MMDNETAMRRTYELLSAGDVDGFGRLLSDDFVEHEEVPGLSPTREGVLDLFRGYLVAFPDLRMEVLDLLASGDKTVARVKATGTHDGEFMGLPPSGRAVEVQLIDIMRFEDGLVVEHWGVMDMLGMLQQLGALPDGLPA